MDFATLSVLVLSLLFAAVLVAYGLYILQLRVMAGLAASEAARVRASLARRKQRRKDGDDADGDDLPEWAHGLAAGVGLDLPALMAGDPAQVARAQEVAKKLKLAPGEAAADGSGPPAGGWL